MIHLFNRKELLVTYDQRRFNTVRDTLAAASIDYQYRVKDLTRRGSRGGIATFGVNFQANLEYKLYVHALDYDRAMALLRSGG